MPFYVYGQDRPGVDAELLDLTETHWSYMDSFADRLILRGPTLSGDGTEHTGSVHVVYLPDRASADRFATQEPYWRGGLCQDLTTARAVVLLQRDPGEDLFTLVTGQWSAQPADGAGPHLLGDDPDSRLIFVALLVDDHQSHSTGIVAVADAVPDGARSIVQPFADRLADGPVALTAQRWCRGGRR